MKWKNYYQHKEAPLPAAESDSALKTPDMHTIQIHVIQFSADTYIDEHMTLDDTVLLLRDIKTKHPACTTWIDINGTHDRSLIEQVGRQLNLHYMTIEDIAHDNHIPKSEEFANYLFLTFRMIFIMPETNKIDTDQIFTIFQPGLIVSFQKYPGDIWDPIRRKLRENIGNIRSHGTDYLLSRLLDAAISNYYYIVQDFEDHLEIYEEHIMKQPTEHQLHLVFQDKREILALIRAITPFQMAMQTLKNSQSALLSAESRLFFSDVVDHINLVLHAAEAQRELVTYLIELYSSSVSIQMNQVMKLLTVITTIFIPLTFIVGLYGMNFKYMPELQSRLGYPLVLLAMFLIALVMVIIFRKKRWI